MGFEEEDARKEKEREQTRTRMAAALQQAIDKEGLAFVLADILLDPQMASMRYRRK